MIRCAVLRSKDVSVVSNIVVTKKIEKMYPRVFFGGKKTKDQNLVF